MKKKIERGGRAMAKKAVPMGQRCGGKQREQDVALGSGK